MRSRDYELLLLDGSRRSDFKKIELRRRGGTEQQIVLAAPGAWFNPLTQLGEWPVEQILIGIVDAINCVS